MSKSICRSKQFCFSPLEVCSNDVIAVKDAFAACDAGKLLSAVLEQEARWHMPDGPCREKCLRTIEERFSSAFRTMKNTPVQRKPYARIIFVPWDRFEVVDDAGMLRRRLGAAAFDARFLPDACQALAECGGHLQTVAQMHEVHDAIERASSNKPWAWEGLSLSMMHVSRDTWRRTLGHPVWIPWSLCERERYAVMASIFWAMTRERPALGRWRVRAPAHNAFFGEICIGLAPSNESFAEVGTSRLFTAGSAPRISSFDGFEYASKLSDIASLLNYNCWADLIEAMVYLNKIEKAA